MTGSSVRFRSSRGLLSPVERRDSAMPHSLQIIPLYLAEDRLVRTPLPADSDIGRRVGCRQRDFANSIDGLLLGTSFPAGKAPGIFGIAGIFTNPQFQVVIRALNQKKGVDLMSAPKVTTKSGRKAMRARVAREFPYPTEFSPPEPPPPTTGWQRKTGYTPPGKLSLAREWSPRPLR